MPRIISWNGKGLRSPQTRMMVLRHLKKAKDRCSPIAEDTSRERGIWEDVQIMDGEVVGSAGRGRIAGVLILVRKN